MHISISKLTIIGSDKGLSPGRCQAIIGTVTGILLIGPLGTNFSEILIIIHTFSFKKIHFKMSFIEWQQFCLSLNVLNKFASGRLPSLEWYPSSTAQPMSWGPVGRKLSITSTQTMSTTAWCWNIDSMVPGDVALVLILNSLALERFEMNFWSEMFKLISEIDGWGIPYEIGLRWMPQNLADDEWKLGWVMAWCRQATSHYLSQSWSRSLSPYDITTPQRG